MPSKLALIAAVTKNHVIGKDGGMPWHIPEDLKYFRDRTSGQTVIMGRKTWDSIGIALAKRRNIVVTSDRSLVLVGAETAASLEEALALCEEETVFCIGGASLYEAALPLADVLYLTEIDAEVDGDTFFPKIATRDWIQSARTPLIRDSWPTHIDFTVYTRKRAE